MLFKLAPLFMLLVILLLLPTHVPFFMLSAARVALFCGDDDSKSKFDADDDADDDDTAMGIPASEDVPVRGEDDKDAASNAEDGDLTK